MAKAVVYMEGGVIQNIVTDQEDVEIIIVDRDTDDLPASDLKVVHGDPAYVINWTKPEVDPELVGKAWDQCINNPVSPEED